MERMTAAEYRALMAKTASNPTHRPLSVSTQSKPLRAPAATPKSHAKPSLQAALMRLMATRDIINLQIKPEEELSIAFSSALRQATLEGRLTCVWTHPANEIAGLRSRKAQVRYAIAKAMGMIDGAPDYLFLWGAGSGALEAKIGRNKQQPNQVDFQAWCEAASVPYRVFTSVEEGLQILSEWKVLKLP